MSNLSNPNGIYATDVKCVWERENKPSKEKEM